MIQTSIDPTPKRRRNYCLIIGVTLLLLVLILFVIALVLALTVFKQKRPHTQLLSATLDGIFSRLSFPVVRLELNITLILQLLVKNPNSVSFRHGPGKSYLYYRGNQVGEADLDAGMIPSKGSETFGSRLTLEIDEVASNMTALINDVMAGKIVVESSTRIPGRVSLLGIFKKGVVATSYCQFNISVPAMSITSQECKSRTKF